MCDNCWLLKCAEEGEIRIPVRIKDDHWKKFQPCCFCGESHASGILVRRDQKTLKCIHIEE